MQDKRRAVSNTRAQDLIAYLDASPTPHHAVVETIRRLQASGFSALEEQDVWKLKPGDKHYVSRNGSSLVAFVVGTRSPATGGFSMVGAHTDSPNLKLKPKASYGASGYRQVGVEVYGGVLLHTWFDRDLSVAGRLALLRHGKLESVLIDLETPLFRIPNLAIHLNRDVNKEGFTINPQNHLPPVFGLGAKENATEDSLLGLLAEVVGVKQSEILDHDLSLYDVQGATLAGADECFIHSARLDNLASCHSALGALLETADDATTATKLIVFYDHEEVGSRSAHGAQGPFLRSTLNRIVDAHEESSAQGFDRAIASSFLVSADMAHAVHPNYADKHDPRHRPEMGKGPVIKANANQSYATDGESAARFSSYCKEAGFSPQSFVTRTDLGCGSTIGPITAAALGVKTVDVGNPMLSMHSIREMAGTADLELMHQALVRHFNSGSQG